MPLKMIRQNILVFFFRDHWLHRLPHGWIKVLYTTLEKWMSASKDVVWYLKESKSPKHTRNRPGGDYRMLGGDTFQSNVHFSILLQNPLMLLNFILVLYLFNGI